MILKKGVFEWDIGLLSKSLVLDPDDVVRYFTDGRRVSFMLECRIAKDVVPGRLAGSEGAGFDLIDSDGAKWEVRSITAGGIYFCPSYMVGSGRRFDEAGFNTKLLDIRGFIVSDVTLFPRIPFWVFGKELVEKWYKDRQLGAGTKINRDRALKLLRDAEG